MAALPLPATTTASVLGVTSTLLLSGLNIGTSLLLTPHLPSLPAETSAPIFDSLYHTGAKAVVPLAATSILSFGFLAYELPARRGSLAAAAALVAATLAWTATVVMPVNTRLVGIARARGEKAGKGEVAGLLRTWEWMNYVRGFVALGAGVLGLSAVVAV